MKRIFDIVCSASGLVTLSPLLLWIAWRIQREGRGSVFYRGYRVGFCGKPFRIYKFRTMVVNAENLGGSSTADGDERITIIGKFLRKYKLDELPQLINVFKGEMSFVGPRPEVKEYVDLYTEKERQILNVRPGITDWASIWNADEGTILSGSEDPDEAYLKLIRPTKLKLQLRYVHERSLFIDMKIIYLTLRAVFQPESQTIQNIRNKLYFDVTK
jgi:lipopolysaccharide/colanic/teichoic acid biosynthesis glycosyltransferase